MRLRWSLGLCSLFVLGCGGGGGGYFISYDATPPGERLPGDAGGATEDLGASDGQVPDLGPAFDLTPSDAPGGPDLPPADLAPAEGGAADLAVATDFATTPDLAGPVDLATPDLTAGGTCRNGLRDGDESDVDCGGQGCPRCAPGKSCARGFDCQSLLCTNQKCDAPSCFDEFKNGLETDVDCGGTCPKCALGRACLAGGDCASGLCQNNLCRQGPTCSDNLRNQGESDVDCGGPNCPRCNDGKRCQAASDCKSNLCPGGLCVPAPSCNDGLKNQTETDVDCGGQSGCPRCVDGRACVAGSDCASAYCQNNQCRQAPSCNDGLRNQNESDIDCGGVCPKCLGGRRCNGHGDCESGDCANGVCTQPPSCNDGVRNGQESDTDCGGANCPKCAAGRRCGAGSDCASGQCQNGVCGGQPLVLAFANPVNYAAGTAPYAIADGDYDRDGKPDLAVVHATSNNLIIFRGLGDGTLVRGPAVATVSSPYHLAAGDLNGDGKLDLATAGINGALGIHLGDGAGGFGPVTSYPAAGPWGVALHDLNRDQRLDVVVAINSQRLIGVLLGAGDGTVGGLSGFGGMLTDPAFPLVGDFNGDQLADCAVADRNGNAVRLLLGDGKGALRAPTTAGPATATRALAAGDLNGDGRPDLVASANTAFALLLGRGDGTFTTTTIASLTGARWVVVADFNRDGKLDVGVSSNNAPQVAIHLGRGDGTFDALRALPIPLPGTFLWAGDLDGDGLPELAVAPANGTNIQVLRNTSK